MSSSVRPETPVFGAGSISLGLHPHGKDARETTRRLLSLARLGEDVGFDGVTLGEHHAGFAGYLPIPMMASSWILDEVDRIWAAPSPLILPLRSPGVVVEEAAWLAARHPGRFGFGVAPGYLRDDFASVGADLEARGRIFRNALSLVTSSLRGDPPAEPLSRDPAIQSLADAPIPVLATAAGPKGVRRAAHAGAGILLGAFLTPARVRDLVDIYLDAGGSGPRVLVRRAWIGSPTPEQMRQMLSRYVNRGGEDDFLRDLDTSSVVHAPEPGTVARLLADDVNSTGITSLNLRLTLPGAVPSEVDDQIRTAGALLLPAVREAFDT